jgi:hypothetical protein
VSAVWVLHPLAKRLGLLKALGQSRTAKLALWLILESVIAQGSRLSTEFLKWAYRYPEDGPTGESQADGDPPMPITGQGRQGARLGVEICTDITALG